MADTITHSWQTVEQAAVTLNVSTRTIARRIAGNTIESRVDENGRRQVLVETFSSATSDGGDAQRQTANVGYDADDNTLAIANGSSVATVSQSSQGETGFNPAANSVLIVLQSTIDAARGDAARARTGARWAWAGVAAMAVTLAAGGMLLVGRLTRAETRVEMLHDDVVAAKTDLERSRNDLLIVSNAKAVADHRRESAESRLTDVSTELSTAESKRQAIESELAVAKRQAALSKTLQASNKPADKSPTTQNTLFGRLVNLPLEP